MMERLKGMNIFGMFIDKSIILDDLVRLSWQIKLRHPQTAIKRLENLVMSNLSCIYTFNQPGLVSSEGKSFPSYKYPKMEIERLALGTQSPEAVKDVVGDKYCRVNINKLSLQLGCRVGKPTTYALLFGILLAACDLADEIKVIQKGNHAWVMYKLFGVSSWHVADPSIKARGFLEKDNINKYKKNAAAADFVLSL